MPVVLQTAMNLWLQWEWAVLPWFNLRCHVFLWLHVFDHYNKIFFISIYSVKQSSAKKRKSGDLETEFPTPLCKRKRVSFGGHLEPELFDKRLPPDSPLCKGATPGRRSLCAPKMKQSLLRRASAIGLIKVSSIIYSWFVCWLCSFHIYCWFSLK